MYINGNLETKNHRDVKCWWYGFLCPAVHTHKEHGHNSIMRASKYSLTDVCLAKPRGLGPGRTPAT